MVSVRVNSRVRVMVRLRPEDPTGGYLALTLTQPKTTVHRRYLTINITVTATITITKTIIVTLNLSQPVDKAGPG